MEVLKPRCGDDNGGFAACCRQQCAPKKGDV